LVTRDAMVGVAKVPGPAEKAAGEKA